MPSIKSFQRLRDTQFVPYKTDDFAAADGEALKAFLNKYPGAAHALRTFVGMRSQFLEATPSTT